MSEILTIPMSIQITSLIIIITAHALLLNLDSIVPVQYCATVVYLILIEALNFNSVLYEIYFQSHSWIDGKVLH